MSFHEVLFPADLSFGSSGGPERRTEVISLGSGFEERNTTWAHSRRRYDAGLGLRHLDDVHEVIAFFEGRLGMLHGFRWKDWADFKSCAPSRDVSPLDQLIGIGDGAQSLFQLQKTYASGPAEYARPVSKPVAGSVVVAVNGTPLSAGADFTVDPVTGVVAFATPPGVGEEVAAGFDYHVPVRFDTDRIEVNLAAFEVGEIPSIPIIEVRL
ncbi:MAG: DUF2460 domain-containing protein [Pseudomonadota bacterium]